MSHDLRYATIAAVAAFREWRAYEMGTKPQRTQPELLEALLDVGIAAGHEKERIPAAVVRDCVSLGAEGVGLLALFIGVAAWGIRFPLLAIPPKDPVGIKWHGSPARQGKHLTDCEYGGLGIAHFDSGALLEVYATFGGPPIPPAGRGLDFNAILKGRYRDAWLGWARDLIARRDVWGWMVRYWLGKYWNPAVKAAGYLETAVLNARIANSSPRLARQVARYGWQTQAEAYVGWMAKRAADRGQETLHGAHRGQERVLCCARVVALMGWSKGRT